MFKKTKKLLLSIIRHLLILIFFVFIIESITRLFFFLILQEKNIFRYGFSKDLEIHTLDLSKFEISIFNRNDLNLVNRIKPDKNFDKVNKTIVIWTFGGSTTKGNNCGSNSSSWPNELQILNKKFIIKNFAQNGYHTDKSVPLLWKNLKKEAPNIIIWSHKFNENKAMSGSTRNKKILNYNYKDANKNKSLMSIKRIDKSFKQSFLFYYFLDQIVLRINIKFNLIKPVKELIIDNKSWEFALKNYEINTVDAINMSKKKNVNEFYIASFFEETDVPIKKNSYFNNLYDKIIYKLEQNTYSKVIDLTKNVEQVIKDNFYCDGTHKTFTGNQYEAEEIYKYLINNSKILNN